MIRRNLKAVAALLMMTAVYAVNRAAGPSAGVHPDAAGLRFARLPLPVPTGPEERSVRPVHPSLARIQSWISSVGAAVVLSDLDGNGLPDDVVYVDTRTDQVIVTPAPGTGLRYAAFALPLERYAYQRSTMAPMGCLAGDFNEDGAMDLLVYFWGRTPLLFLKASGSAKPGADGYRAQELVPEGGIWNTNAALVADVDGDGHLDLVIANYFPDGAHILDTHGSGREHMQEAMSRASNGGRKHLLLSCTARSRPDACFLERPDAFPAQTQNGWTLALGAADLDGDLLPELYIANDFGPDRLLHNDSVPGRPRFSLLEGRRKWTTPKSKVLGHDSFKGMGVDFGDINGDGIPDIFVSNIAGEFALEESHFAFVSDGGLELMKRGIAPYTDRSEDLGLSRSGWGWDVRLGDFNNDGVPEILRAGGFVKGTVNRWPELHELAMGNDRMLADPMHWPQFQPGTDISGRDRNNFYVRSASGRYVDVAGTLEVDGPFVTRGIATADIDGDGRLDFAIANQWQDSLLFHNESTGGNQFVGLHLLRTCKGFDSESGVQVIGGHAHPCAFPLIGAVATVQVAGGTALTGVADGGSGHSGKRSPDVLFGLGRLPPNATVAVQVRWRDARGRGRRASLSVPTGWHTVLLD